MGPIAAAVTASIQDDERLEMLGFGDFWRNQWATERGDTLPFAGCETQPNRESFIFFAATRYKTLRNWTPSSDRTGMRVIY